ncbi:MAG: hypothetical protein GXP10_10245 [Gammaproteobacteria bacterium]|nr:hypothetical protein [Gammaproteobacteria bacterium]
MSRRSLKIGLLGLLITLLLLVEACGFRLRGSTDISLTLADTYVTGSAAQSRLAVELRRALRQSGVTVVESRDVAEQILTLDAERKGRRAASLNTRGNIQDYELRYEVDFSLSSRAGEVVLPRQTVTLVRSYSYDQDQVLAKDREEQSLYRTMRSELVRNIMRRLQAVARRQP